jgi:hypothetical protein
MQSGKASKVTNGSIVKQEKNVDLGHELEKQSEMLWISLKGDMDFREPRKCQNNTANNLLINGSSSKN